MRNLKLAVLFVFVFYAIPTSSQGSFSFPTDGTGLLDYCSGMASELNHTPPTSTDRAEIKMMKAGWCAGFLHAMHTMIPLSQLQQAKTAMALRGVDNPAYDSLERFVSARPDFTCFPAEASDGQLVQVLDKFLRDHPAKLHESDFSLAVGAFHDAFPCEKK
jgi:Rap1a immunity proteins